MTDRARIPLAALSALMLLGSHAALACTCANMGTPREEWAKSDDVFLGRVVSIGEMSGTLPPSGRSVRVVVAVEQRWRGAVPDTIEVYTGLGPGDCGYPFASGGRYLIYANRVMGTLVTNICTRTRPAEEASEDIRELDIRQEGRPGIRSYAGLAATQVDGRRFGVAMGVGFDLPLSSYLTGIVDAFINPISSTQNAPIEVKGMIAVTYGGVKVHVGDVMYFAGRAGLSWLNLDSKTDKGGSIVTEQREMNPVANFGLGFEADTRKFVRPYGEVNLVAIVGPTATRWVTTATIGANFDL